MKFKAVAFDVDGTLYPNSSMYLLTLPLLITHLRLFRGLEDARKELRQHPDLSADFHRVQAQALGHRLGITPERAYALTEGRIYTRWFKIFKKLKPFPYLQETVAAFQAAGLKLGVMSDFPIRGRLRDMGLNTDWDACFSSEETGYLKPHPQPFLELARRLETPPAEVLYVGNSYSYDVLGAQAAGMPCAHLTKKNRPDSLAVLSFRDWRTLKAFVLDEK